MAIYLESALIVSYSEKSADFFIEMVKSISCDIVVSVKTCGEARRLLLEKDFDLCIINAPLQDETGENLSKQIATSGICQVILCVKSEYFEEISAIVEEYGVITVSKPLAKQLFWSALKLAKATLGKMKALQDENSKLMKKIEEIRIVDRAKSILMSYYGMSEPEAHKYIEKHAMDTRSTKRTVAEGILKTYEN